MGMAGFVEWCLAPLPEPSLPAHRVPFTSHARSASSRISRPEKHGPTGDTRTAVTISGPCASNAVGGNVEMDNRLNTPWIALRFGIGLTATLAGIDKFFNLLADWGSYVSPI